MERNGYSAGDLDGPSQGDTFVSFTYDWRRSNVSSARKLVRQLERLASEHAVVHSQRWLKPAESAAFSTLPAYYGGGHFSIIMRPVVQQKILENLLATPGPDADTLETQRDDPLAADLGTTLFHIIRFTG